MMQMDVQQGCPRHVHAPLQSFLDVLEIIEPLRAEEIDDQMAAGVPDAIKVASIINSGAAESPLFVARSSVGLLDMGDLQAEVGGRPCWPPQETQGRVDSPREPPTLGIVK